MAQGIFPLAIRLNLGPLHLSVQEEMKDLSSWALVKMIFAHLEGAAGIAGVMKLDPPDAA